MRNYDYIKINDYYFCLQQNPAVFAWILFFKRDDLITIHPWLKKNIPCWTKTYFQYHWNLFKGNLINLIVFLQCRFGLRHLDTVRLPVYGHFGMQVHKGYKTFNLRNYTVTKIFDSDVSKSSIMNEIEQLKKVSQISFAPSLKRWDINERWYQEEYLRSSIASAHRSSDSVILLKAFCQEAMPCMRSLIFFQAPETKDLTAYLKELIEILEVGKLSDNSLDSIEAHTFREFVHSIVDRLQTEGNCPVSLVLSHGDFCPANLLSTRNGLKIIDWEGVKQRSVLFDFYSYFFYRPVAHYFSVNNMASEIEEALPVFISGVSLNAPDITNNLLSSVKTYRLIYYIERLCMLVERDVTDKNLNMTDFIMRYIKAFQDYENLINKVRDEQ